ncbi:hypothetical protein LCGC14_1025240 [marine sediment metagenome]|uniref:Uncharacterized protein n=1 Tax=marine sediment metagenome TaxID=412755 RepID=A0A0F9N0T8_9ZZZZ
MLELLGYIFLYLIIGVVLLPFYMIAARLEVTKYGKKNLAVAIIFWPIVNTFLFVIALVGGWIELKNHL